ncbi:hypothetical protein HMI56_004787 [Coelomomyces lativittatus]|nr:hypothetical protein HMI56_004787 [Coelomomyces lativittatus]
MRSVKEYVESKGSEMKITLPQNPRGNVVIEHGHKPIIEALAKLSATKIHAWPKWTTKVFWAD